jgi:hypothetical protein
MLDDLISQTSWFRNILNLLLFVWLILVLTEVGLVRLPQLDRDVFTKGFSLVALIVNLQSFYGRGNPWGC